LRSLARDTQESGIQFPLTCSGCSQIHINIKSGQPELSKDSTNPCSGSAINITRDPRDCAKLESKLLMQLIYIRRISMRQLRRY